MSPKAGVGGPAKVNSFVVGVVDEGAVVIGDVGQVLVESESESASSVMDDVSDEGTCESSPLNCEGGGEPDLSGTTFDTSTS